MTLARVWVEALGAEASALGFGCASLGSRMAPQAGIAALARAYDAGVTWYDVAPSYGDGQAELLLGRFLNTRPRDTLQVLTKVGIAPPEPSLTAKLLRPVMRTAVTALPALRAAVRRRRPAATKIPIDAAVILRSLDTSLRRLGTDYVDVLALHDASPDEVVRDDVRRALETAMASGKARVAAIASSPEAAAAGVAASNVYALVQMGNNLLEPGLERFRTAQSRQVITVTHSVFGNDGAIEELARRIERTPTEREALATAGYYGRPAQIAADLLADFAFLENRTGIVIVSMFKESHLLHNLARHARTPNEATMRTFSATFGTQHD